MTPYHPEAVGFLKSIFAGEWAVSGVLADWLEERDDPRGKLLRRRWRRWEKEKLFEASPAQVAERLAADRRWERSRAARIESLGEKFSRRLDEERARGESPADIRFRTYLRTKFRQECCEAEPLV